MATMCTLAMGCTINRTIIINNNIGVKRTEMDKFDTFSKWLDRISTQQEISEKKHVKTSHKRRVQKAKEEYMNKSYEKL